MASQALNHKNQRNTKDNVQSALEKELGRLKANLNLGYELMVKWSPIKKYSKGRELSGEVLDNTIHIYEEDVNEALKTLKHEYIDHILAHQLIIPYRKVVKLLFDFIEDECYHKKEKLVEALTKLL